MYRLLENGEVMHEGDEYFNLFQKNWTPLLWSGFGATYKEETDSPIRRRFEEVEDGACVLCGSAIEVLQEDE